MKNPLLDTLSKLGALLTNGHFVYTSGRHGSTYMNKDALYPYTTHVQEVCHALAKPFVAHEIDVVVGPTIGGVILSQWVAYWLTQLGEREVLACYSEERAGKLNERERYLGRGYADLARDKRVLVVEDVITTGGSVRQVVEAIRGIGGNPVAISALCNRGKVSAEEVGNVPVSALLDLDFTSWESADCPLCAQGIPINTNVGKGAKLAQ